MSAQPTTNDLLGAAGPPVHHAQPVRSNVQEESTGGSHCLLASISDVITPISFFSCYILMCTSWGYARLS